MSAEPAGGDTFEAAYTELFVRAQRSARRILADADASEDVAAEALARAYARWPRIASYATPWVTRVAVNLALDEVRRKPTPRDEPRPQPDAALDRLVVSEELAALPRRQREAIALRYVLELNEVDAAAVMGVSPGTLHTHAKRGLARLRADAGLLRDRAGETR